MPELAIRRMVMYKHGVGYFERRGTVSGTSLRLTFAREAMDDVLKSLVVLDLGAGQVHGVDFETPEDRAAQIARGSIHLSDNRSLLDLLRDLRGRHVRLWLERERPTRRREPIPEVEPGSEMPTVGETQRLPPIEGLVIGIDIDEEEPLRSPLVSIYQPEQQQVRSFGIRQINQLDILDASAAEDVSYFLRAAQREEDRRSATVHLSEGEHELLVGYVAPAPAWRVSYRLLLEEQQPPSQTAPPLAVLLQGWGLFDNQLDEDLENVALTLVAGMPISFRYRLYEPHTPERPLIVDEDRAVAAPVEFGGMPKAAPPPPAAYALRSVAGAAALDLAMPEAAPLSIAAAEESIAVASVGQERGALFQYQVAHPVSVARGQSAMVPIVGQKLEGRKDLLYNGQKLPNHPVASLRVQNTTGLTLERGPVTVIEEGDYAGEAVLPFTRAGGELIVPYAVELGIRVHEEYSSERRIAGVQVRDGYLLIQEWDLQHISYRINNTLEKTVEVVVERALLSDYQLTETANPSEQSQGLARWPVLCLAGTETAFAIHQRRMFSRHEHVRGFSQQQLQAFLQQRFLDEATYRSLGDVLAIYRQIEVHEQRIRTIEQERAQIYEQQRQIQGNLAPLGRDDEEGALRSRYVGLLGELEDRLNALAVEQQRLRAEIERLEREAAAKLAELSRVQS